MNTSTERANITKALLQFQKTVKGIKKDSRGYNYNYISLDQILELVRPALSNVGIVMTQPIGHMVVGEQILSTVETVLTHESGEWISSGIMPVKPTNNPKMSEPQNLGSAITYAKRYQITALLGLSADVDTDATNHENAVNWGQKISKAQTNTIAELMKKKGVSKEDMSTIIIEVLKESKPSTELSGLEADMLIGYLGKMESKTA